jgi:site-specific DNA-cytosine methylase
MKILELFAGSRSIGKAAAELGMESFSSDIEQFGGIDYVTDILAFDPERLPWVPDIIWASPPCTGFSVASISHHWTGGLRAYIPKSETARLGIKLLEKTLEIISLYPNATFFIENPRGVMRKMPQLQEIERHTVTYCQYGDERMKPTDIWTNSDSWTPRKMCKNGDKCHVSAPRGAKTGTQGRVGAFNRSKVPHELCLEILRSTTPTTREGD